ncbi:hypothetical protein GGI35DRAFT_156299 [Trichoderma velutinum]
MWICKILETSLGLYGRVAEHRSVSRHQLWRPDSIASTGLSETKRILNGPNCHMKGLRAQITKALFLPSPAETPRGMR